MKLVVYTLLLAFFGTPYARDFTQSAPDASTRSHAKRIVGGVDTTTDKWPFVCSIYDRNLGGHKCAGALLKGRTGAYLLTTGFCLVDTDVDTYEIYCSHYNLQEDSSFRRYDVQSIVVHEDFSVNSYGNDIALMELVVDSTELAEVQPACLPSQAAQSGDLGTVMGWGATYLHGLNSDVLQELNTTVVVDQQCADAYNRFPGYFQPSLMFCTHEVGTGGPCTRDSGAPFVIPRDGCDEVAGMVSWGYDCAHPEYPDVFTNVTFYRSWIIGKIPDIIL